MLYGLLEEFLGLRKYTELVGNIGEDELGDTRALDRVIEDDTHRLELVGSKRVVNLIGEVAFEVGEPLVAEAFDEAAKGEIVIHSVGFDWGISWGQRSRKTSWEEDNGARMTQDNASSS